MSHEQNGSAPMFSDNELLLELCCICSCYNTVAMLPLDANVIMGALI